MEWKLYYDDGTTYSSDDGEWVAAPPWGVVGLATITDWAGYERWEGDYYFESPFFNAPWVSDIYGVIDFLIFTARMNPTQRFSEIPPQVLIDAGVKFGRMVDSERWRRLSAQMADDPEMPHKSTMTRVENRRR